MYEMILKSGHWPKKRGRLKIFLVLALVAFVQQSETIMAILVKQGNNSLKLF